MSAEIPNTAAPSAEHSKSAVSSESSKPSSSFATDALQLLVLSTFIVSQPLLDRLSRQVSFLIQEQIGAAGLLLATAAVMFAVPVALVIVEWIVKRCFGDRTQHRLHRVLVFVLFLLFALYAQLALIDAASLQRFGLPGVLLVLIGASAAYGLTSLLEHRTWFRKVVVFASVGVVVFPATFLMNRNIREVLAPTPPRTEGLPHAENPVPIVMIVFDGFTGMALLDETHEIDPVRYPNFARLSQASHWFRNATTIHPRTTNAVPAILSGCMPRDVAAIRSEYPQNLFQLVHESGQYEMTVFEPYTRLCPPGVDRQPISRSPWQEAGVILESLSCLYAHLAVPSDLPPGLPTIPRAWFGLPETSLPSWEVSTGLVMHSWDRQRGEQFEHFLDSLQESETPGFRFLHVVMPHYPWDYYPDGRQYIANIAASQSPIGSLGLLGEEWTTDEMVVDSGWRRYLMQVMYVDSLIGQLLDRLESTGLMDDCLLVIAADHGTAFVPGYSRREPVGENLPDLLSIPLFIKLPGQTEGETTDRNVESIDILPTITDVIGMELSEPVDGGAIFDESVRPRLRKNFLMQWEPLVLAADFPERYRYVDRMVERFGTGSNNDRLSTSLFMPELIGRPLESFEIEETPGLEIQLDFGSGFYRTERPDVVPCFFEGRIANFSGEAPVALVFALNDEVIAVTRTIRDPSISNGFTVLAMGVEYQPGDNDLQIFELRATAAGTGLRRCMLQ